MTEFIARLQAADRLLLQHAGGIHHERVSSLQRAALVEMMSTCRLSAEARAEASVLALGMKFFGDDLSHVLAALESSVSEPLQKRRRCLQDFQAILQYWTADEWAELRDPEVSSDMKLSKVVDRCIGLGLRCPSEPSLKMMCSQWLFMSEEKPESLDRCQKQELLKFTKGVFDKAKKRAPECSSHIMKLPISPTKFLEQFPALFRVVFPDALHPIPPPIATANFRIFHDSYGCRGSGGGSSSSSSSVVPRFGPGADAMTQVAATMQHMMQMQQRMMQLALGQSAGLDNLQIRNEPRRMPTVTFGAGGAGALALGSPESPRTLAIGDDTPPRAIAGVAAAGAVAAGAGALALPAPPVAPGPLALPPPPIAAPAAVEVAGRGPGEPAGAPPASPGTAAGLSVTSVANVCCFLASSTPGRRGSARKLAGVSGI